MILLIDGYNLIKQVLLKSKISEYERKRFINELGKYAKIKGHKIELVFDGGPYDRPSKEKTKGIYLIYAGAGQTADDFIKRYLEDHRELDILLVTSDRDVCNAARRLGIEHIGSKEFYVIMQNSLQAGSKQKPISQTKAIKTSKTENEELDLLMQEASKVVQYKSEDFEKADLRTSRPHKLSKKERMKLKKIKKL